MHTSKINVPIPTNLFLALAEFLEEKKDDRDPVTVIEDAIEYWMDNADWKPELLSEVTETEKGYWWKEVFLPHGTTLRMKYKGNYYYAKVVEDNIVYEEKIFLSPSKIANTITNSSRNAWRDFEVKRPKDEHWNLATVLKREIKKISKIQFEELFS